MSLYIGTAGWTIPPDCKTLFPEQGTHLERYAQVLNAVEINSSFYRPHQIKTYERWSACVPDDFKFSVKLPREITHKRRFVDIEAPLNQFLAEATSLGERLGPILIQLPPSFAFDAALAESFFDTFRTVYTGQLAIEARHASWFGAGPDAVLAAYRIAGVAADPAPVAGAGESRGWGGLRYVRLHGSPRIYYSEYTPEFLADVASQVREPAVETWCIFDNTVFGFAMTDALKLAGMVRGAAGPG